MAKPIEIGIASETKAFKQGIESGVIEPLEDAEKALTDLGKSKGAGEVEQDLESAQKATRKLRNETKDTADAIEKNFRASYSSVKKSAKDSTDSAADGLDDVKSEAASSAKETAASFDGSADSITGMFQEVAANAFAGFGPAGLVAGLAAAAGIGLISAALNNGKEDSEEFRAEVAELTEELINAGAEGGPSLEYIVDKLKELATASEDGADSLKSVNDQAKETGSNFRDLAQAYAGNAEYLDALIEKQKEQYRAAAEADVANSEQSTSYGRATSDKTTKLGELGDKLRELKQQTEEAAEQEALWVASGGPEMQAKADHIAHLNDAYDDAAGSASDFINAETNIFDTGAYIAAMETRRQQLREYSETLATSSLTPEAKAFLDSQGSEAAATFAAGYKAASPAQQEALNQIWSEAGRQNSGTYSTELQNGMPDTVTGPSVAIPLPDFGALRGAIATGLNAGGAFGIRVQADVSGLRSAITAGINAGLTAGKVVQ